MSTHSPTLIRKYHKQFQPSNSKRLEIIPCLNLGTDDTRQTTPTLEEFRRGQKICKSLRLSAEIQEQPQYSSTDPKTKIALIECVFQAPIIRSILRQ